MRIESTWCSRIQWRIILSQTHIHTCTCIIWKSYSLFMHISRCKPSSPRQCQVRPGTYSCAHYYMKFYILRRSLTNIVNSRAFVYNELRYLSLYTSNIEWFHAHVQIINIETKYRTCIFLSLQRKNGYSSTTISRRETITVSNGKKNSNQLHIYEIKRDAVLPRWDKGNNDARRAMVNKNLINFSLHRAHSIAKNDIAIVYIIPINIPVPSIDNKKAE